MLGFCRSPPKVAAGCGEVPEIRLLDASIRTQSQLAARHEDIYELQLTLEYQRLAEVTTGGTETSEPRDRCSG